ncbi:hypothetical protein SAMD00019534_004220 [Acytostelium subglobosum LB1]|uniref:hypothetical protein n=1 Tax=Acytostelium subglobosum LB1 TaxID=1410327 RepID=UPI000644CCC0|nr:hypothetical protein SAMD00019534_004220 [Acytostelium subglobosum LB1]GAM17247.1 hypothetical protein SAMD00019534_004220 [Acytostelium subglobosum LB1]|eukprot:XP_012759309.1 hypothetical protein SAMD00019534_004220 [Acytostelium subglobosum LB1]
MALAHNYDGVEKVELELLLDKRDEVTCTLAFYYSIGRGVDKNVAKSFELLQSVPNTVEGSRLLFKYWREQEKMSTGTPPAIRQSDVYYDLFTKLLQAAYKKYYIGLIDRQRVHFDSLTTLDGVPLTDVPLNDWLHSQDLPMYIMCHGIKYEFSHYKVDKENLNTEAMIYFDVQRISNIGQMSVQKFISFSYREKTGDLIYLHEVIDYPTLPEVLETQQLTPDQQMSMLKGLSDSMVMLCEDLDLDHLYINLTPSKIRVNPKTLAHYIPNDFVLSVQINFLNQDPDTIKELSIRSFGDIISQFNLTKDNGKLKELQSSCKIYPKELTFDKIYQALSLM